MPLQDWADLSPSAITIATDDTGMADVLQPVLSGPDTPGLSWAQQQNVLKGRLRIQNSTGDPYVLIDPSTPEISLYESGSRVARLGDLGNSYYGLDIGSDPPTSGGIRMTASDLTGYNTSGQQRFQIVYGGANQGDITCGDFSNNKGFQWDESAQSFTIRGSLYAQDVVSGTFIGRTFLTTGSFLTAATTAGDSTIYINDNSDFPNSGTGWIYGADGTRDEFTYTGKSSEGLRLTGCVGVGNHISGLAVIPQARSMIIDKYTNEMHFYGDNAYGDVQKLASIGLNIDPGDPFTYDTIATFGTSTFYKDEPSVKMLGAQDTYVAYVQNYNDESPATAIYARGIYGVYADYRSASDGGPLLLGVTTNTTWPSHSAKLGTFWATQAGYVYIDTSAGWLKFVLAKAETSFTWDPPNLADGTQTTHQESLSGVSLGDFVLVSAPYNLQGIICTGYVDSANHVTVLLRNETGGAIDLASGTWKVQCLKKE